MTKFQSMKNLDELLSSSKNKNRNISKNYRSKASLNLPCLNGVRLQCLSEKRTGELRYCIDYRALNAKTCKDNYSLPLIEYCLDSLYGKSVFCVLDLCSGYY